MSEAAAAPAKASTRIQVMMGRCGTRFMGPSFENGIGLG
jgi:hypothetical protein